MNRNQVLPQAELPTDPSALRRVDLSTSQAYQGKGFLAISSLTRVAEEVSTISPEDGIEWEADTCLEDSPGEEPKQFLNLSLKGHLHLLCQRCLQDCPQELAEKRRFALVSSEEEADKYPMDDDLLEPLVARQHFDLLGTIEDEILLSLPLIPKHSDGQCQAYITTFGEEELPSGESEKPENPFNILKNMKKG
jgi:uncharacterized protein